jgi:hypothetical protein
VQNLSNSKLVDMPSCNFTKTFLNKSSNRCSDLYVSIVDDFIGAFMKVMRYRQYFKGNQLGDGLGKEKLQLRVVQRSDQHFGYLKVLDDAMAKMPGIAKFCTLILHMEGEEVFGSQTRHAA